MARSNPYAPVDDPYTPPPIYGGPVAEPVGGNPYAWIASRIPRNPYTGYTWTQPKDELERAYYNKNPGELMSLYSRAFGGTAGGSLEHFIRQAMPDLWADYTKRNQSQPDLMFSDTLTGGKAGDLWQQWQSQTPYQRGENPNLFAGAGRRT